MTKEAVRRLVRADLVWVVDVAAARRARLVPYAPRFWHPAPRARAAHTEFLGELIEAPDVRGARVAVVTLPPEDETNAAVAEQAGYRRTTDFLE